MSQPVVYQVRGQSDCDPYHHVRKPVVYHAKGHSDCAVSKPSCHIQLCIRSRATVTVVYPNHHVTASCADRLQASGLDGIDPVLSCVFETTPVPLRPAAIWKCLLVFVGRNIHLPCVCLSAGIYLVSFEPFHFPHIDLALTLTLSPHLDFRAGRRIAANLLYLMPSFVCRVCVCLCALCVCVGGGGVLI